MTRSSVVSCPSDPQYGKARATPLAALGAPPSVGLHGKKLVGTGYMEQSLVSGA